MAYQEGTAEILMAISKLNGRKEKIEALQKKHNSTLEVIADMCFNPNVEFLLPEGAPPYTPAPKAADQQTSLVANIRKMRVFIKGGGYDDLRALKREQLFVQFLESLDPDDAELVVAIKDKKMPYKGVTRKLFEEAWPARASTWVKS